MAKRKIRVRVYGTHDQTLLVSPVIEVNVEPRKPSKLDSKRFEVQHAGRANGYMLVDAETGRVLAKHPLERRQTFTPGDYFYVRSFLVYSAPDGALTASQY